MNNENSVTKLTKLTKYIGTAPAPAPTAQPAQPADECWHGIQILRINNQGKVCDHNRDGSVIWISGNPLEILRQLYQAQAAKLGLRVICASFHCAIIQVDNRFGECN
jgi:hypothetical protein